MCLCGVLAAASHPTNFHARQDWTDTISAEARARLKPLSKSQPTHLLSLSLIQFLIQNDKTVYLTFWGSTETTWTIWSWFKWGGLHTESQQLHSCFCRKAGISSTGLALDLSLGCKPANAGDMEDPEFDSWDSEPSSVIYIHKKFTGRRRTLVCQWNPPVYVMKPENDNVLNLMVD